MDYKEEQMILAFKWRANMTILFKVLPQIYYPFVHKSFCLLQRAYRRFTAESTAHWVYLGVFGYI
tara:strand:+ start:515 stop:709 length:195 start_codon:yes stop_codon:yes gene_type:complete